MNCWRTLGIAPTSDLRVIKRGYLSGIKRHRPEDDAQAFQHVRQAYETALEHATQPWLWPDEAPEPESTPIAIVSDVDTEPAAESNATPPETVFPSVWTDDELPDWLRSTAAQTPLPADEPATVFPRSEATPCAAANEPPSFHDQAAHLVANLLDQWSHADPAQDRSAILALLWCQREWQPPATERALELALCQGLTAATDFDDPQMESDIVARMAPLIAQAAAHYGWFSRQQQLSELPDRVLGTLLSRWLTGSVAQVWQLAASGDTDLAQKAVATQLAEPLFMQLDLRRALAWRWAEKFSEAGHWPSGLAQAVFAEFDWAHEPGFCPPELLQRYQTFMDRTLLARIATGEVTHEHIDPLAAGALLERHVGLSQRAKSIRTEWHTRINRALIWMQGNAPEALQVIEPEVLRFWVGARPVASGMWKVLGVFCAFYAYLWVSEHLPGAISTWVWLLVIGVTLATSAVLGFVLAGVLAWLRVQWVVRLYWPWSDWDRRLTRKMPVLRRWVTSRDIGLTRDWLPVLALYVFQFLGLWLKEQKADAPLWEIGVVALVPTIFIGAFWRGALLMLADAPGADNWRALHQAGVWAASPVSSRQN
jgi:hypothetical protein